MNAPQKRKLAAILFADIVGYTALMQTNEPLALSSLQKFKTELESKVSEHQGEIIQFYGDGCLATFDSSVDAVTCAKNLQLAFQCEPKVPVRIGLHAGDVVFRDGNVFGDAVNIASRVESMGISGGVLLSSNVRNQIKNQPEFDLVSLGKFEFKNVTEGMTVYALANEGFPLPKRTALKGKFKTNESKTKTQSSILKWVLPLLLGIIALGVWQFSNNQNKLNIVADGKAIPQFEKTIAVIPFRDLSPEQNQAYFADGIVEAIRSKLAQVGNLRVTSMTSVLGYRDNPKSIGEIAKELSVTHILEGTVYRDNDKVRVIAQLINTETDEHLWAETYDEELIDIFQVQTNIANNVTKALQAKLTPQEAIRLNDLFSADIDAYDMLLSAKSDFQNYSKLRDTIYLNSAIEKLHQSIALDSLIDNAYLGYADYWFIKYQTGYGDTALDSVFFYAEKCLQVNPYNDYAYSIKSYVNYWQKDFDVCKENAERSLELSPSNVGALFNLARYYSVVEQLPEKQVPLLLTAIAIEPQNPSNPESNMYKYLNIASIFIDADLYVEADAIVSKIKKLYPENLASYHFLRVYYIWKGDFEESIKYGQLIIDKSEIEVFSDYGMLGIAYFLAGNYEDAEKNYRKVLSLLNGGQKEINDYIFRHRLAAILWETNRKEEAKLLFDEHIEKCLAEMDEKIGGQVYDLAGTYAFLGDKEKAYEWLEKVNYQNWLYNWMRIDPFFDNLREEDRFKRIIGKWEEQIRRFRKKLKSMEVDGELMIPIES